MENLPEDKQEPIKQAAINESYSNVEVALLRNAEKIGKVINSRKLNFLTPFIFTILSANIVYFFHVTGKLPFDLNNEHYQKFIIDMVKLTVFCSVLSCITMEAAYLLKEKKKSESQNV